MISSWGARVIMEPQVLKAEILNCIKHFDGNRSSAAFELGIPHRTFYNLLLKLGIPTDGNQPRKPAKPAKKKTSKIKY
jgi:DNA-binding NtrC family response regulator